MRRLTRNLLTNGRVSVPRNGALLRRLRFKATPLLTTSGWNLHICRRRFQSTSFEEKSPEVEVEVEVSESSETTETPLASYTPLNDDGPPSTPIIIPRTAYIAIGSNIGNRISWIERALVLLKQPGNGITVKRTSSLWETEPMYVTDQGKFLNGVIEVGHASDLRLSFCGRGF